MTIWDMSRFTVWTDAHLLELRLEMLLQVECVQISCEQELVEREKTSGTLCSLKAWKIYTCKDDLTHHSKFWHGVPVIFQIYTYLFPALKE